MHLKSAYKTSFMESIEIMSRRANQRFGQKYVAMAMGLLLVGLAGCYQRPVAPELTADQSQVEKLSEELKDIDWD